jgi:serine phosphatase RsbU (regulator of sigma subunit)
MLFCSFFVQGLNASENKKVDSLMQLLRGQIPDTLRVKALVDLSRKMIDYPDSSFQYANQALLLSKKINYEFGMARSYASLGEVYNGKGNYNLALKSLVEAYSIYERLGRKELMATTMNSIGNTYMGNNDTEKALASFKKCYSIAASINDPKGIALSCFGIGNIYGELNKLDSAYAYLERAFPAFEQQGHIYGLGMTSALLGQLKNAEKKYDESLAYLKRSMEYQKEINNVYGIGVVLQALGKTYYDMGDFKNALDNYLQAFKIHKERNAYDNLREVCRELALTSKSMGDFKTAFEYQEKYMEYNDSVFNEKSRQQLLEVETKYQTENREKELKLKNLEIEKYDAEVKSKTIFIFVFAGASVIFCVLAFFAYRQYKLKKFASQEILLQKNIIEEKNKNITDSIRYAQYIQESILPDDDMAYQLMRESFVLYKPKDIVSGDFYWIIAAGDYTYIAAVDCTGHGVPGAFMSMIGHNALSNAIKQLVNPSTSEVLAFLQDEVRELFRHNYNSSTVRDGMDLSLIRLDRKNMKMQFSGANNPLCLIRDKQLIEYKGDKFAISANTEKGSHIFNVHHIDIQKGDCVYLFSDGFADQFGGPKGKKFKYKQFQEILLNSSHLPMNTQKTVFLSTIETWMTGLEQIDDILLIGFRI